MLIALHEGKRKTAAEAGRGVLGACPWTGQMVKSHIGNQESYWAYQGGAPRLENGYELDTPWHAAWKSLVRDSSCEVVFGERREHMADIYDPGGHVIELQQRPIGIAAARERIKFYKEQQESRVIWLINIEEFWRERLTLSSKPIRRNTYRVSWKPVRKWLWDLAENYNTHVYVEFNRESTKLLKVWIHGGEMFASFKTKRWFFDAYLDRICKPNFTGYSGAAETILMGH